jgi:hypothetical protein
MPKKIFNESGTTYSLIARPNPRKKDSDARPYTTLKKVKLSDTSRVAKELEEIKELNTIMNYESSSEVPLPPEQNPRLKHIYGKTTKKYNWTELRKHWVLGKRIQLEDGTFASEDYTYKEFAEKFEVNFTTLRDKVHKDKWQHLRKAYLARVNERNIGQELGLYVQENYQAEIAAVNACNKLGVVLDRYIEHKFGEVLDASEDLDNPNYLSEETKEYMNMVNNKTGTPIFLNEVKEAITVASNIYKLQRQIYENAPKEDMELFQIETKSHKFKTPQERQAAIKRLEAKLGRKLNASDLKPSSEPETIEVSAVLDAPVVYELERETEEVM